MAKMDVKDGVADTKDISKEKPNTHQDKNFGLPNPQKDENMSTDRGKFKCRE